MPCAVKPEACTSKRFQVFQVNYTRMFSIIGVLVVCKLFCQYFLPKRNLRGNLFVFWSQIFLTLCLLQYHTKNSDDHRSFLLLQSGNMTFECQFCLLILKYTSNFHLICFTVRIRTASPLHSSDKNCIDDPLCTGKKPMNWALTCTNSFTLCHAFPSTCILPLQRNSHNKSASGWS